MLCEQPSEQKNLPTRSHHPKEALQRLWNAFLNIAQYVSLQVRDKEGCASRERSMKYRV